MGQDASGWDAASTPPLAALGRRRQSEAEPRHGVHSDLLSDMSLPLPPRSRRESCAEAAEKGAERGTKAGGLRGEVGRSHDKVE